MATTAYAGQSPVAPGKRFIPPKRVLIALDGSGNGSDVVTYSPAFDNTPIVSIVPPLGLDAADFTVASSTKSGCTLTVTACAELVSQNVEVIFTAHERL